MFWKQNDSGIYGRRQDMFLEELARSDRVGTIVHFDNPISPETLRGRLPGRSRDALADQSRLVATETVARCLGAPGRARGPPPHLPVRRPVVSRRLGCPAAPAYTDHVAAPCDRHG